MNDSADSQDSYLLRVKTLIKKRRKLFFFLGVLAACSVLLPVIAYLIFVPHQVLAFYAEIHAPWGESVNITVDLKSLTFPHKGTFFEIDFNELFVGNQEYHISPDLCVVHPRSHDDFASNIIFNRHLYSRGEVRTVRAGKCRNYYDATGTMCLNKGFIYQMCERYEEDGKMEEGCFDFINHRKLSPKEKALEPATHCPRYQATRFEAKLREEGHEGEKIVVIDRYRNIYYTEEKRWGFVVVKGYKYVRKIEEFTCDISRDEGQKYESKYKSIFVSSASEIVEYNEELDCTEYKEKDWVGYALLCVDKQGFIKRYCYKGKNCMYFTEHKLVEANDKRFTIENVCEMPESLSVGHSKYFRMFRG
ncbi:hypothetical protein RCL1_001284 [Eukaryota sp. TZLM3-RCL]